MVLVSRIPKLLKVGVSLQLSALLFFCSGVSLTFTSHWFSVRPSPPHPHPSTPPISLSSSSYSVSDSPVVALAPAVANAAPASCASAVLSFTVSR